MISKQEGGTDHGKLAVPGEKGDWVARNLIPSLPVFWMLPASRRSAPSPGLRASTASRGGPAWTSSGRSHAHKRRHHLNMSLGSPLSLAALVVSSFF